MSSRNDAVPKPGDPDATYDVIVVGGGPAGVGAALGAARTGKRVLVVEQCNCLGGIATAGAHGHISTYEERGTGRQIVGGVAREVADRIAADGFGRRTSYGVWFEIEGLKLILDRMAGEAGVELLYYSFACDALMEDGAVQGVVVQNKGGRRAIRGRRVVDCTGDGDVAALAGCPYEVGRPSDGKCQPVTLMFTIGGVDWARVEEARPDGWPACQWAELWARAQAAGDMEPFQTQIMGWWWTPTRPDHVNVNFTHVTGVDATRAQDLTRATIEARRQAFQCVDVYRKHVPGMENCYMVSTAALLGVRESRRIMGEYVLTEDDIKAQRRFDDNICYGAFFIDIHHIDGPGMDSTVWDPPDGFSYHIPYRCLVPRGAENLLVAGRCLSATHLALGSTRVMVQCIGTGEGAGTAAALSLDAGVRPRELGVARLQSALRAAGGIISDEDIRPAPPER
jgi:hypothetical protein